MSDWVGVVLALLAIVAPLVLAWWLLARGLQAGRKRHGKMPR
ncbi:hypothetical protein [Piscinibacter sp.]